MIQVSYKYVQGGGTKQPIFASVVTTEILLSESRYAQSSQYRKADKSGNPASVPHVSCENLSSTAACVPRTYLTWVLW